MILHWRCFQPSNINCDLTLWYPVWSMDEDTGISYVYMLLLPDREVLKCLKSVRLHACSGSECRDM